MRNLIRRLASRHDQRRPTENAGPVQGRLPLRPWQIRDRCFNVRRRGLDPVEIRAFLHRVADELAVAQTALVAVQEENVRIKNALRAWQSAQSANNRYR
ncbi:DivIVA domain-containing protein [Micromonospora sp. IBHARD004]|uniref:DivIVA domain-containing protein n=1 Tax=Micromonospora sp. IBHARD004 TaxID=3457764 RepID=UPI0040580269